MFLHMGLKQRVINYDCYDCKNCPSLSKCTESKEHVKMVTRHIWADYLEKCEDIRHTIGNKEIYDLRKETIERIFGTAKEQKAYDMLHFLKKQREILFIQKSGAGVELQHHFVYSLSRALKPGFR